MSSAAVAPVALAAAVSLDAVTSISLVVWSFRGPLAAALLPDTADVAVNIAAGLGDLLALTLLHGCLVMLPLLGLSATLPWLAAAVITVAAMTGWLVTKAVLVCRLAGGASGTLLVPQTGVALHVPTLLAAEVLGAAMGWALLALVWINRRVIRAPAAGDPSILLALNTRSAAAMQQQRAAVEQWVQQAGGEEGEQQLTAPLLAAAAEAAEAAEAGQAGVGVQDEAASFVSAHSRQLSNASFVTAPESLPAAAAASVPPPQ